MGNLDEQVMSRGEAYQRKIRNKARADQACHRLIPMARRIATLRAGRVLLQSWHLMRAVNLGAGKWNDMLKVQQLSGNGDDPTSSLRTTVFYPTAD